MASAKQCDRCKKFYTKNVLHKTCGSIRGSVITGISTIDRYGGNDTWYDLCDSCLTDLSAFLHNYKPGADNHKEEEER